MTVSIRPRSLALLALGVLIATAAPRVALPQRASAVTTRAPALSPQERRIRDWIDAHQGDEVALLERAVDIPSGTMNKAGVRRVGDLLRQELDSLGFTTRWIAMPDSVNRAGHLYAERKGTKGKKVLLIGHLDTVFETPGTPFQRHDSIGTGPGSNDMKGGDVAIIYALKALRQTGALNGAQIVVLFSGDEESAGSPLSVSRGDLIDAGKRADVALAFEGGSAGTATVARRGASGWILHVNARQAHSSGVFSPGAGDGAIYEAARILDGWRRELSSQQYLTFNPGVILGGAQVTYDSVRNAGTASGKLNIIAPLAVVHGDLRFLSDSQLQAARARMRDIATHDNLPQTSATVEFFDEYPAMSPTAANYALLARFDSVSQALGYGPVQAFDPGRRGAGDISFVAPYVTGLDGLGVNGTGAHTPDETVNLNSLRMSTERAAVLLYRLTRSR